MKRPILVATIAYINGIIIGVYLGKSIPLIVIISIITLLLVNLKKIKYNKIITTYAIVLCIASIYVYNKNVEYENKYLQYNEKEIKVVGIITSDVEIQEYKYSFTIKVNNDYLLVNVKKKKEENSNRLEYGDKIQIIGTYKEPSKARNYKGFDYKNYLKTNKIYGTVSIDNYNNIKVISHKNINIIDIAINNIRGKLKNNIKAILPEETAPLAMGILIGYDSEINENVIQDFKNSNLSHMLAISGAHINYVILTVSLIFNRKRIGIRKQRLATIVVMLFFMKITQMTPSVVRAGASCIIYMLASLLHEKADIINTMSISILLTLLNNPFNLFSIGMQLSYAGTISIIIFYNSLNSKIKVKNKILKYLKNSILVTISANIFIIPIMAYHFNTISLTFILSNLCAGPVLGIAIILGIIISIISFISLKLAIIPTIFFNFLLLTIINISKFFGNMGVSKIIITTPSLVTTLFYFLICLFILKIRKISQLINIKKLIKSIAIIILIIIVIGLIPKKKFLQINFIDVGQGDSTLIKTVEGKVVLIDGGGSTMSNSFDVGNKTLLPYLLDKGISKIDYIMVSHFDSDHCQGLNAIIENMKVENIIICKQSTITNEYLEIMEKCNNKKIKIITVKRGDKIKIDTFTIIEIFHPTNQFLDDGKGGLNANAIVCKLNYKISNNKYFTMLFTGDIEEEAEKQLELIYGTKLKADVLKVAHHGSKTSSTEEFIKLVSPKIALIGVGKDNKFGHPNEGVLKRLNENKAKIYRTDLCGEISLLINKNGEIKIKTQIS